MSQIKYKKKKKNKNSIFKGVLRLLSKNNLEMPREENIEIEIEKFKNK
jgi:hypothetical protein